MSTSKLYRISQSTAAEYPKTWQFIVEHFLYDEYINSAIGYGEEDVKGFLNHYVYNGLKSGMSLKCVDKQTGEIVGCRISNIIDGEAKEKNRHQDCTWKELAILDLLGQLNAPLRQRLKNSGKLLSFEAVAVRKDVRRVGLAFLMNEEAIRLGRLAGCTHVVVGATGGRSQRLYQKLGFTEVNRIRYDEYTFDGVKAFDGFDDGLNTTAIVLYAKKL